MPMRIGLSAHPYEPPPTSSYAIILQTSHAFVYRPHAGLRVPYMWDPSCHKSC